VERGRCQSRIGPHPVNSAKMKRLYMTPDRHPFTITGRVKTEDFAPAGVQQHK
jgi:hypothetical protein